MTLSITRRPPPLVYFNVANVKWWGWHVCANPYGGVSVPKSNVRPTIQSQNYKIVHKKWILITAAKVFEEKCTFRKKQN